MLISKTPHTTLADASRSTQGWDSDSHDHDILTVPHASQAANLQDKSAEGYDWCELCHIHALDLCELAERTVC
jgi:hypothetical protein